MVPLRILNSEVMRLVSLSLDTGLSMAATAEDFRLPTAAAKHDKEVCVALRQIEEVLQEVALTNKKVFKTIHELLRFLGLDECKTQGRVDAKGHTWRLRFLLRSHSMPTHSTRRSMRSMHSMSMSRRTSPC